MKILTRATLALIAFPLTLLAQDSSSTGNTAAPDTTVSEKITVLPIPTFGYSPETSTYVGAVVLFTLNLYGDTLTRTSNASVEFSYTWRNQIILESDWDYFFEKEEWGTKGLLHYSKYPDYYFGIGANSPEENKTLFKSNRFVFESSLLQQVRPKVFAGVNGRFINYSNVGAEDGSTAFPELVDASVFGLGISLVQDSRNSLLTPTSGTFLNINPIYNWSHENYWKVLLDARAYETYFKSVTLAGRFFNEVNSGALPFFDRAFLGGDKFVRGYFFGRYRDNNLSTLQSEVRFPVWWRLGGAVFGGVSNVYSGFKNFQLADTKLNYGLGLRILVDKEEGTNMRFDYAIGQNGNSGFYVSFGESF